MWKYWNKIILCLNIANMIGSRSTNIFIFLNLKYPILMTKKFNLNYICLWRPLSSKLLTLVESSITFKEHAACAFRVETQAVQEHGGCSFGEDGNGTVHWQMVNSESTGQCILRNNFRWHWIENDFRMYIAAISRVHNGSVLSPVKGWLDQNPSAPLYLQLGGREKEGRVGR
jgi:hypothetical protein